MEKAELVSTLASPQTETHPRLKGVSAEPRLATTIFQDPRGTRCHYTISDELTPVLWGCQSTDRMTSLLSHEQTMKQKRDGDYEPTIQRERERKT